MVNRVFPVGGGATHTLVGSQLWGRERLLIMTEPPSLSLFVPCGSHPSSWPIWVCSHGHHRGGRGKVETCWHSRFQVSRLLTSLASHCPTPSHMAKPDFRVRGDHKVTVPSTGRYNKDTPWDFNAITLQWCHHPAIIMPIPYNGPYPSSTPHSFVCALSGLSSMLCNKSFCTLWRSVIWIGLIGN